MSNTPAKSCNVKKTVAMPMSWFTSLCMCVAMVSSCESRVWGVDGPRTPTLAEMVVRLRHQEQLTKQARAVVTHNAQAPTPEDLGRVGQVLVARGLPNTPHEHCITPLEADQEGYQAVWKRSGARESLETSRRAAGGKIAQRSVATFDGAVVREAVFVGSEVRAALKKPDSERDWHQRVIYTPYYLILARKHNPWWKVLESNSGVQISTVMLDGVEMTKVVVPAARQEIMKRDELYFDGQFRLKRRDRFGFNPIKESSERLLERHEFHDYRDVRHPSGESVLFPARVTMQFIFGECPDGRPAVWSRSQVTVDEIELGVNLPDAEFIPELPPGTPVKDLFVTKGDRPGVRTPISWWTLADVPWHQKTAWRVALVLALAAIMAIVVFTVRRFQRERAAGRAVEGRPRS